MSFEKELNEKYQEITQKVSHMIPEKWKEFYLCGENNDDEGTVYFFYKNYEGDIVYSMDIETRFDIDPEKFQEKWYSLFIMIGELRGIFIKDNQEPFFSVIFHVTEEGKLGVEFDYINWDEAGFDSLSRTEYFKYHYLGIKPDTDFWANEVREIEKYLAENK